MLRCIQIIYIHIFIHIYMVNMIQDSSYNTQSITSHLFSSHLIWMCSSASRMYSMDRACMVQYIFTCRYCMHSMQYQGAYCMDNRLFSVWNECLALVVYGDGCSSQTLFRFRSTTTVSDTTRSSGFFHLLFILIAMIHIWTSSSSEFSIINSPYIFTSFLPVHHIYTLVINHSRKSSDTTQALVIVN